MPTLEEIASVPRMEESAREQLADKISDKLNEVFNSEEAETDAPEPAAEVEKPSEEAVDQEEAKVQEEPESSEVVEKQDKEEAAAPVEKTETSILPAAYRRSLKNYEWTDEEIENALKQGGSAFVAAAAKIHATRNKETADMAAAGRAARQGKAPVAAPVSTPPDSGLAPIDVAALKKQYGDEAIIDRLAGPLNATIAQINQIMPVIKQAQDRSRRVEIETIGKQVDTFFMGKDLEPFADTYGRDTKTVTEAQMAERNKVLELADAIVGGANLQGRRITLEGALQLALDSITGGTKEQAARANIVKSLKTREKGISLKPSARIVPGLKKSGGNPREAMEKNVKARLDKVFASAK